ncbi:FHA domain-containing protein DDL-like [Acanthaster planci]|uniref:FHA domain-containing protein DDL-like n=1 Tax=Acanthaster planci TaxID=133434 RepID=A0A8B7XPP5_ACAPL|nr:FHA domain-containing protein DDL-like [Acanthaster planci]
MSSKSSRNRRHDSDSDDEGRKHHHHRHHHHDHGHRDRHGSRSRSRSPRYRTEKKEKHGRGHDKHNHSRDKDLKPRKHKDTYHEDNRKPDRHQKDRLEKETTEKKRDHERAVERRTEGKNGEKHQMSTLRGKWDDDPGVEINSPGERTGSRENNKSQQAAGQMRIKQEREWNDNRRTQDAKRKPPNPFETGSDGAGPSEEGGPPPEKEKPNFATSGKLTEDTNTYRGIVIKYNEPPEARKPKRKWRLYVFKGDQELPLLHIHRQSAYLLGRERLIADVPIDHPSCSKQHAVLQYRLVQYERPDGTMGKRVRPYIIDLESSNGTYINNNRIEPKRYYELHEKDVIKFGYSTREYVLLHDKSKDDDPDGDVEED